MPKLGQAGFTKILSPHVSARCVALVNFLASLCFPFLICRMGISTVSEVFLWMKDLKQDI